MRGRTILGVAAAAAVALPAAAQAGPRADYKQMFTTSVPGASTGTDTQILYKHPDDPNAKPIPVRQEVFTFPEGTTFDDSVVPACKASDLEVQLMGPSACPRASWTGQGIGDTTMTGFPGAGESAIDVDGWNDGSGTLLFGRDHQTGIGFATRARRQGRVITVDVPRTPGGPPDGESALRWVHNVFGARSRAGRFYIGTPGTCPASGVWTFTAHLTFADGAVEDDTYEMACNGG
jgi:hypothetical protein